MNVQINIVIQYQPPVLIGGGVVPELRVDNVDVFLHTLRTGRCGRFRADGAVFCLTSGTTEELQLRKIWQETRIPDADIGVLEGNVETQALQQALQSCNVWA